MEFQIPITIKPPDTRINYQSNILLIGSCFTEHIGNSLQELKFPVLQNPNGILFDPYSVSKSLTSYTRDKKYTERDFFELNEVWYSWEHHGRFSNINLTDAIRLVNDSQQKAHKFLKKTDWIIITLGSAFSYQLTEKAITTTGTLRGEGVANCHRAPAQWFDKHLMTIDEIVSALGNSLQQLFQFNPGIRVIFTVSPVRHIRDGAVENNRSKARLIESIHHLISEHDKLYYFPAYELVIDVLRDYRFYDADLVHPNYMATEFVLEKFGQACIDDDSRKLMDEVRSIVIARKHKAVQPETMAHRRFLRTYFEKAKELMYRHPSLDLQEEVNYFSGK